MSQKHIFAVLMLMVCLSVFGQTSKNVSMQGATQHATVQTATNQQESIKQLQTDNESMKAQLDRMEKEIEFYRGDVRAKNSEMNNNMTLWFSALTLVMAILGVAIPLILNKKNEKVVEKLLADAKDEAVDAKEQAEKAGKALNSIKPQVEEVKTQVAAVTSQAEQVKLFVEEIETLKQQIDTIEKGIRGNMITAENAAKQAKISQLTSQALAYISKGELKRAINNLDQAIELDDNKAMLYRYRGLTKNSSGDNKGALKDLDKAIELDENNALLYQTRGLIKKHIKDYIGAMDDYNKAIEIDPGDTFSYGLRGDLKREMGKEEGAEEDYTIARGSKSQK